MNWDAIVALSQIIAAVGVILSLVFVGLQIKQNTRALLETLLKTPGGESWLRKAKHVGFHPGFVTAVDAILAKA